MLKEARSNICEKVADLTKQGMDDEDMAMLKDMLSSIERLDELLQKPR